MKKVKLPASKAKRFSVIGKGGPWDAMWLLVPGDGTMVFSVGGMRGSYNEKGQWRFAV